PGAVRCCPVGQSDRFGPQVFVGGVPADLDVAVAGHHVGGAKLDEGAGGIDLDGALRKVAANRGGAAEAVAVGDDNAQAIDAVAGQLNVGGALLAGVICQTVPGLAVVGRHEDIDLADAAGADLIDAIFDRGGGGVDQLMGNGARLGQLVGQAGRLIVVD